MRLIEGGNLRFSNFALTSLLSIGLLTLASTIAFSQGRVKPETIEASAMGTGTQTGQIFEFRLLIYEFSTEQDRQNLVQAFEKGQTQGLFNALSKMKAVGHVSLTGTIGYDCSFIRLIPTQTGRKIRFVTNRPLRFGEELADSPSTAFDLSGGEIEINDQDKKKSGGVLLPRAQLVIDKEGQLKIDLTQNPWKLVNVLDWKGTPGVN